jgi:hypothetical protein
LGCSGNVIGRTAGEVRAINSHFASRSHTLTHTLTLTHTHTHTHSHNSACRHRNWKKIQGDTKKRELLKYVVAAMYSWQHYGTGTLSYRQPRHLVTMDQWSGQQRAVAIILLDFFNFCWAFQKFPCFCVTLYTICTCCDMFRL